MMRKESKMRSREEKRIERDGKVFQLAMAAILAVGTRAGKHERFRLGNAWTSAVGESGGGGLPLRDRRERRGGSERLTVGSEAGVVACRSRSLCTAACSPFLMQAARSSNCEGGRRTKVRERKREREKDRLDGIWSGLREREKDG